MMGWDWDCERVWQDGWGSNYDWVGPEEMVGLKQ